MDAWDNFHTYLRVTQPYNESRAKATKEQEQSKDSQQRRCFCPDDCNCHYPHRTNFCGCRQHD